MGKAEDIVRPEYNCARGGPYETIPAPATPPFTFQGVTARVFPLKANISRLTEFCDQFLNMDIPPEMAYFRPAVPYVYLTVLNYGRMSVAAENLGWVSQREVTFMVALEWYRKERGKLVFKDWACVSPFIYVDDDISLTTGREVYGWPKVKAWVEAEIDPWASHPRNPRRLMTLSTHVFPKVYAGERQVPRVLLEVDREPTLALTQMPPDLRNPVNPIRGLPTAISGYLSLVGSAMDILGDFGIRGYRSSLDVRNMMNMAGAGAKRIGAFLPGPLLNLIKGSGAARSTRDLSPVMSLNTINLKQFRDPRHPEYACYQAIINSKMGVLRFNRGGMLGDSTMLRGDPTGGFSIRIHRYDGQPVIEALGIEADDDAAGDESAVATLRPVLPFWTDVDLYYGSGEVVCERSRGCKVGSEGWRSGRTNGARGRSEDDERSRQALGEAARYNTARGAALQNIAGPFHFPDVTLQVYPLLADKKRLERFCHEYLNRELDDVRHPDDEEHRISMRFEPFGTYVYMVVTSNGAEAGKMWSETNNIGWWAGREVAFYIPVKWYRDDELVSLGLLSPYVFANSGRAVATERETNGRPATRCVIESPPDAWLKDSGPTHPRSLLKMEVEVLPTFFLGQAAQRRTILEINQEYPLRFDDRKGWQQLVPEWGELLASELKRKTLRLEENGEQFADMRSLGLEILAHGKSINTINLKQYRDVGNSRKACYQAVVRVQRSIERVLDLGEIDDRSDRIHILLHRYPSQPIVETLGLEVKTVDSKGSDVVNVLQPIRPFWMRVALKEELGKTVCWRSDSLSWTASHDWFRKPDEPAEGAECEPLEDDGHSHGPHEIEESLGTPYFWGRGLACVGSSLSDMGRKSPEEIKPAAFDWLRFELTGDLAYLAGIVKTLAEEEFKSIARLTDQESRALVEDEWKAFVESLRVCPSLGPADSALKQFLNSSPWDIRDYRKQVASAKSVGIITVDDDHLQTLYALEGHLDRQARYMWSQNRSALTQNGTKFDAPEWQQLLGLIVPKVDDFAIRAFKDKIPPDRPPGPQRDQTPDELAEPLRDFLDTPEWAQFLEEQIRRRLSAILALMERDFVKPIVNSLNIEKLTEFVDLLMEKVNLEDGQFRKGRGARGGRMTFSEARAAVEVADEPQIAIEQILHRGWGNSNLRWEKPAEICIPRYSFESDAAKTFAEGYGLKSGGEKSVWWYWEPAETLSSE